MQFQVSYLLPEISRYYSIQAIGRYVQYLVVDGTLSTISVPLLKLHSYTSVVCLNLAAVSIDRAPYSLFCGI